jgi:hypothetical protein
MELLGVSSLWMSVNFKELLQILFDGWKDI